VRNGDIFWQTGSDVLVEVLLDLIADHFAEVAFVLFLPPGDWRRRYELEDEVLRHAILIACCDRAYVSVTGPQCL
jgi:hypothetical protein